MRPDLAQTTPVGSQEAWRTMVERWIVSGSSFSPSKLSLGARSCHHDSEGNLVRNPQNPKCFQTDRMSSLWGIQGFIPAQIVAKIEVSNQNVYMVDEFSLECIRLRSRTHISYQHVDEILSLSWCSSQNLSGIDKHINKLDFKKIRDEVYPLGAPIKTIKRLKELFQQPYLFWSYKRCTEVKFMSTWLDQPN